MERKSYVLGISLALWGVSTIFFSLTVAYLDSIGYWGYPKDFSQALFQSRGPQTLGLGVQIFHFLLGGIVAAAIGGSLLASGAAPIRAPVAEPQPLPRNLVELTERVRLLEDEKTNLRLRLRKYEGKPSMLPGYTLLAVGTIALISATVSSSPILAFIGLGLAFWGALLMYTRPSQYVRRSLLTTTAISSLVTIGQEIGKLEAKGRAVYLPPKHLEEMKGGKVYLNPGGPYLTPPGVGLANLYEKELGVDFAKADLDYLQTNLPRLLVEDLEIAEDLQMKPEEGSIKVSIEGSVFKDLCREVRNIAPSICASVGCPLISSIALAITRTTGKQVVIEENETSADGSAVTATFRFLGETESKELATR